MNTRAINAADTVVRRYNSRNPEEIISRRAIKVKDIRYCRDLLGYYSVMLNCEYIGINPNCTTAQRVSALAHELGHAFFDRSHATFGQAFQDTYFYSLDNSRAERRANIFAAELLLSDDDVLKPIGYYEFNADRLQLEASLPSRCSSAYRAMKYQELLQEFQYTHSGLSTPAEIAQTIGAELIALERNYRCPQSVLALFGSQLLQYLFPLPHPADTLCADADITTIRFGWEIHAFLIRQIRSDRGFG